MSRRSLPKKSLNQPLWFECEKCFCTFPSKFCEIHISFCESNHKEVQQPYCFIKDAKLITNNCDCLEGSKIIIKELDDMPEKQKNTLIFMSEEAMRLCKIKIGENISISNPDLENYSPIVRMVWPIENKHLGQIYFSKEDFDLNWFDNKNYNIQIEKLQDDPIPVAEITLKNITNNFDIEKNIFQLSKFLQFYMWNRIYTPGCIINYKFYNKIIKLKVDSHQSVVNDCSESLEKKFKNLNLGKQIYLLCTKKTRVNININKNKIDENSKYENIDNYIQISDIGGIDDLINNIKENISIALGLNTLPCKLKIARGILLHGPSGCGKSLLTEALTNEFSKSFNVQIVKIKTSEIFSKFFGETERNLQNKFEEVFNNYPKPSLITIEDINNLCSKHEKNDIAKRVSIALLNLLDSLHVKPEGGRSFVIATTNNIDNLLPGLRRCGRLDNEFEISVPHPEARYEILKKLLSKVEHNLTNLQIHEISNITHGFVGSDLANLIYKAAMYSLKKTNDKTLLSSEDINCALSQVKPSAMRQVLIENPNIKWDDIGGQHDLKLKLKQAIEWPLLYPDKFKKLGIKPPRGILMFGPPGCSKTMIAKALATESKLNFLSIKGPELFSMWVGESERAVREVFRKARQVSPAIIFFDEIDAIGSERSSDGQSSSVKERVLTQLLTELDGVDTLKNVTIVAATNRPDMIDKALLRPGRIDRLVYVSLPDDKTREEIFKIKLKEIPISEDVKIEELVIRTNGYSGAEIQAICHEAALKTLEENLEANQVYWKHFEIALNLVKPRTSKQSLELYKEYMKDKI